MLEKAGGILNAGAKALPSCATRIVPRAPVQYASTMSCIHHTQDATWPWPQVRGHTAPASAIAIVNQACRAPV